VAAIGFGQAAGAELRRFEWTSQTDGALRVQVEFDRPMTPRVENRVIDNRYYYLQYYGVDAPKENAQWKLDHPADFHVKRLYYPQQRALQLVFYVRNDTRFRLTTSGSRLHTIDIEPIRYVRLGETPPANGSRKLVVIDPGHGGKPTDPQHHFGARTSK